MESQLNVLQVEPLSRRGGDSCSWTTRTTYWVHLDRFSMLADINNEETQPCTPALFSRQEKVSIYNGWDLWAGRMSRLISGQRSKGQSQPSRGKTWIPISKWNESPELLPSINTIHSFNKYWLSCFRCWRYHCEQTNNSPCLHRTYILARGDNKSYVSPLLPAHLEMLPSGFLFLTLL